MGWTCCGSRIKLFSVFIYSCQRAVYKTWSDSACLVELCIDNLQMFYQDMLDHKFGRSERLVAFFASVFAGLLLLDEWRAQLLRFPTCHQQMFARGGSTHSSTSRPPYSTTSTLPNNGWIFQSNVSSHFSL